MQNSPYPAPVNRERTKTPLLFIAVILFNIALLFILALMLSLTAGTAVMSGLLFGIICMTALLAAGGVLLGVYIKKVRGKPELRPAKGAIIALSIITGAFLLSSVITVVTNVETIEETRKLRELNSTLSFTATDNIGEVPKNPKFVFYDTATEEFSFPDPAKYDYEATTASEANVVITYSCTTRSSGRWVGENSGKDYGAAYEETCTVKIYRLDDGSLIDESSIKSTLGHKQEPGDSIKNSEVTAHISEVLSGEKEDRPPDY